MNHRSIIVRTIALVLAALVISGCGGAEGRKAKFLERGKEYFVQENYSKALIEFKNALQIDPKYAEAYFYLGRAEEARGNYQQAFGYYGKAVELNPDNLDARAYLGQFYLLAGDMAKAKEHMDVVLTKDPAHVRGRLLKALIASKENKDAEAAKEASEVIKLAPAESDAYGFVSAIYLKQGKSDKGIEVLRQGITANPKNIPLRLNLAQIYAGKGENDKVEELLQECITIDPKDFQYRANLASFLVKTNQPDKAEKTLRAAIAQDPDADKPHLLLADFLFTVRKDPKAAEHELMTAIKENPKNSILYFGLAGLYEKTGDASRIMDTYREIISRFDKKPEGLRARNQLASMLLREGKQDEAEKLTDEVLKENPSDNDALLVKARLSLLRQDAQGAITALRAVLRDQPNLVDAYLYLADAHMLSKEPELAKESIMKAVESNPKEARAHLALARYYAQAGDINAAAKKVDETFKLFPNDYAVLEAKLQLLSAKNDMKGAQAILERIKAAHPENPAGYYQLGRLYLSQKKYDAAIREFELALPKSADDYQLMSAIVGAHLAQKKPDKAIARLNDALAKDPSSRAFAHELLAEVYIVQKKYNEAEQALRKAIEENPKWNVPYRNLANLHLVRGEFSAAEAAYQQGLQAVPEDEQLLLHLAGAYERTRDFEKAMATYERILKKNPDNLVVANNLASLLTDHKGDAANLKRARELASRFESSPQPAFRDTLAWVYYKSGETDKAVEILKKVVKESPNVSIFRYHLGMAYHKQGNLPEAKIHLAKAVEGKATFPGADEARETLKKIQ